MTGAAPRASGCAPHLSAIARRPAGCVQSLSVGGPWRVALVHDWLNQAGGAEVVLAVLHDLFEDAPIYTAIFDPTSVPAAAGWEVRASWLDRLPRVDRHHQRYLPLYPLAWSTTRLKGFDLVVSNKSGFCHGVHVHPGVHVCYCLTPTRYVWQPEHYLAHEELPPLARPALQLLLPWLRRWDLAAARRVHRFVAISRAVQDRIRRVYGRESTVIHPPAELDGFRPRAGPHDYYIVLSRLVPYKEIDLAVEACNRLARRLVVVGDGRDRSRLERLAGPTIEFRGRLPRRQVAHLLAGARALIWPGVEDYGLAPVEAMAAGRPVVARRAGGVLDTVVEGHTGVFFDRPETDDVVRAMLTAEAIGWRPEAIREHALAFARPAFEARFRRYVEDVMEAQLAAA